MLTIFIWKRISVQTTRYQDGFLILPHFSFCVWVAVVTIAINLLAWDSHFYLITDVGREKHKCKREDERQEENGLVWTIRSQRSDRSTEERLWIDVEKKLVGGK